MSECVFGCDEPAVARVQDDVVDVAVCERHKLEIQTDMYGEIITVELDPEPENAYETLERFPDEGSPITTVRAATLAERYGTPWPVSGDHVRRAYHYRDKAHETITSVAQGTGFYVPLTMSNLLALQRGKIWSCEN